MSYMTSKTPLVTKSWKYQHNYMKTLEIMDLTIATIIHIYTNSAGMVCILSHNEFAT